MAIVDITNTDIAARVAAAMCGEVADTGSIPVQCRGCGAARTIPRPVPGEILRWMCPACDAITEARLHGEHRMRVEIRLEGGEWAG